jgi:hypothetical protein
LAAKATAAFAFASEDPPLRFRGDLVSVDLREVQAEIGMSREAVIASVDLGHGECDPLARLEVERLGQGAIHSKEALQCGRTQGDEAK